MNICKNLLNLHMSPSPWFQKQLPVSSLNCFFQAQWVKFLEQGTLIGVVLLGKPHAWAKNNGNTSQGKWFRSQVKEKHGKAMFKKICGQRQSWESQVAESRRNREGWGQGGKQRRDIRKPEQHLSSFLIICCLTSLTLDLPGDWFHSIHNTDTKELGWEFQDRSSPMTGGGRVQEPTTSISRWSWGW